MLNSAMCLSLSCTCLYVLILTPAIESTVGPYLEDGDTTTCQEFSRYARFNPNSVINDKWFVFYYWGPHMGVKVYSFKYPSLTLRGKLQKFLDERVIYPVNWTAPIYLLKEHVQNETSLLVQRSDRGLFALYPYISYMKKGQKVYVRDVCIKQTGDNKYIGLMRCSDRVALVMSRVPDIPPQKKLKEEASRIGYRGRKGKSYLYQGNEWMPIPEMNEREFWVTLNEDKTT